MRYIKIYEKFKNKIKVFMIPRNDIHSLKIMVDSMKEQGINFDVYLPDENDNKRDKWYYIISKEITSYSFEIDNKELDDFGKKIDYESIIDADKYNL